MNTKWCYLIAGIFISFSSLCGQSGKATKVKYNADFNFSDGVYPNFQSVIEDSPLSKERIVSNYDYNAQGFYDHVLSKKNLYYYDNLGTTMEMNTENIWGYSRNGFLYINIDDGFYRITHVGSISHFIAYNTYYRVDNDSYYNSYSYTTRSPGTSTTEMRQYILDFATGEVHVFDVEGVALMFMGDAALYDEYMALSKKKRKQLKFMYIRKYNERNPLYLIKK